MMQKVLIAFAALCAVAAYGRPRYVLVPMEYAPQYMYQPYRNVYPQYQVPQYNYNYRFSRNAEKGENRRQAAEADEPLPAFAIPAAIRQSEDAIAAGSAPSSYGSQGPDYVDYGAYTGGYGAFGWYSDHPVLIH